MLRNADFGSRGNRISNRAIGAAPEVHRTLGPGFLEAVYEEALCFELAARGIDFARQVSVRITYKNHPVGDARLDLLICDEAIIELKAVEVLLPVHHAQVVSYLRATGLQVGLLLNFNVPVLKSGIKRIVLS